MGNKVGVATSLRRAERSPLPELWCLWESVFGVV